MGNENIGVSVQRLVGGDVVNIDTQEAFGLVALGQPGGGCSGVLIRPEWVVTAAHCLEPRIGTNPIPDPDHPGRNLQFVAATVTVRAAWGGGGNGQTSTAAEIVSFRPNDIALIKLEKPIVTKYPQTRLMFDEQFPYFGTEVPVSIMLFGRGINQLATIAPNGMATPSSGDGKYRVGFAQSYEQDGEYYWYRSGTGDFIAGGDSGGPSFAWVLGGYALVGVHASSHTTKLTGITPDPNNPWKWVNAVPEGRTRLSERCGPRSWSEWVPSPTSRQTMTDTSRPIRRLGRSRWVGRPATWKP